ncbi:hypothetical protein N0V88_000895 [Collariella sp. IMI 366227]|nr:hypothetical protein N0V88_000895 [Collariella sp. IMI 366227]
MIESENLRTASLYINNQLLSRGLLRDGHTLDFADPGDSDGEVAETMSRIMAVVNDLILRRDHLQEKYAEAQRKAGLSEAAETALRTHLRTAEAAVHRLKDEAVRTKSLVTQTRASCANEIRKRDRQIESLKKAVTEAGRARGGEEYGIATITVVGNVGSEADLGFNIGDQGLQTETNNFLAELAKGLSEENEALLQLVRGTTEQLKEMSGWEVVSSTLMEGGDGHALALASNPADMSIEVETVLEHLRTILTNPSFVPIEEVVVREDEIHRLRDGWEKMETRWKEAVHLIDGWRKRMQASGRPVNVEELKMGLRLSPVKVHNVEETAQAFGLHLEAVPEGEEIDLAQHYYEDEHLDLASHHEIDDVEGDSASEFGGDLEVEEDEPNVQILQQSVMIAPSLPHPPQHRSLRDSRDAGNRGARSHRRQNSRDIPTIPEEKRRDAEEEDFSMPPPPPPHKTQNPPQKRPLLSLRPVPPEEAAQVALPVSAVATTPDTSIGSMPFSRPAEEPTTKTSTASASARVQKKPAPPAKKREVTKEREAVKKSPTKREATKRTEPEPTKRATKPPVKARPTRPPITRGRSETRPDDKPKQAKPAPRAASATSAASSRSAGTTRTTNTDHLMPPPPPQPTVQPKPKRRPNPLSLPKAR